MSRRVDLSGHRYGRLTAIEFSHTEHRKSVWRCVCDCGTETRVRASSLVNGLTRSCGCLLRERSVERATAHGLSKDQHGRPTPTFTAWAGAKQRCTNKNHPRYADYGGRGIEFRFESVADLVADIGIKPDRPGLSLDRVDNDGHYEAGNVRWATYAQQNANRVRA